MMIRCSCRNKVEKKKRMTLWFLRKTVNRIEGGSQHVY